MIPPAPSRSGPSCRRWRKRVGALEWVCLSRATGSCSSTAGVSSGPGSRSAIERASAVAGRLRAGACALGKSASAIRTTRMTTSADISADDLAILRELERKVLWLASWTIHHANHVRDSVDGLKVGGHQASSASLATIMTALYFRALRPQDRVAVKPHASPIYHAIQYLLGRQSRERLEAFRGYKGAQSYPSRTKDADDV